MAQRLLSVVLLCICAGIVLGLVLKQQRHDDQAAAHAQAQAHLFHIANPNDVSHITLQTPQDGVFELVRDGEGDTAWHLVAPRETLAEASTIEAMLQEALALEEVQSITPPRAPGEEVDVSIFGLSPPRFTLALTPGASVGETPATQMLAIGKRNNFNGSLFVQGAGNANVSIVSGSFLATVDRNLYALRDKRVALFTPAQVQKLVVDPSAFGPGLTCARQDDGYVLRKPIEAPADTEQMEAMLTALSSLRGRSVVAERAQDTQLSLFGLQTPRFVVRVWLEGTAKEAPATLQVHLGEVQVRGVTHIFARTADDAAPVWELDSDWIMQLLRQDAAHLRDMHVLHVRAQDVAHITVRQHQGTQDFTRTRSPDGAWGMWHLTDDANRAIHPSLVAALVAHVVDLKADRIVSEALSAKILKARGLHKPRVEVDVLDIRERLLGSVLFGSSDEDGVFVTTDQKDRLDHVAQRLQDEIAAAPQTYYDTDPTPTP